MAKIKHRPFNAFTFLMKLELYRDCITTFMAPWYGRIPNLPDPSGSFISTAFTRFLENPPADCPAYEEMLECLYRIYDLSAASAEEIMHEAAETRNSPLKGVKHIPREVLALRLFNEDRETFEFAEQLTFMQRVDKFCTFRGKGPKHVEDVNVAVNLFKGHLADVFQQSKGSQRVLVKHFHDRDVLNFIVYHEERVRAEIRFEEGGDGPTSTATVRVQPFIFRPVRQDFLSYFPATGLLQINSPRKRDRESLRKAFAFQCLGDEDFFEDRESQTHVDLSALTSPDFSLATHGDDAAAVTEVTFRFPQKGNPKFTIQSDDVFETLEANDLSRLLASPSEAPTRSPVVLSAKIRLKLDGPGRAKVIELKTPNSLSFNRASQADKVMAYLSQWGLINQ